MARGLPDYYRGVDIAYQALSELTNRPKYGGAEDTSGYKTVAASDETILTTISGKGMVYGGFLKLLYTSTQKGSGIFVYVDGEKLGVTTFEDLELHGLTVEHCYPYYLRTYDDINFRYCVGFSHGITFETSLMITYVETHGTTPNVWYRVIYALI